MNIRLKDTTVKEKDLNQIVIGDPFSNIHLEGKLNIIVDGHNKLEIPYRTQIFPKNILYAQIRSENYDIATELIHNSFEKSKKEMRSWKQDPIQGDMSALYDYEGYKLRFIVAAKEGCQAFSVMYRKTDDEKYINEALKLLNRLSRTKETASEPLGWFIRNNLYIKHPKIKRAAVKAFVKEKNYNRAIELAKGNSQLMKICK